MDFKGALELLGFCVTMLGCTWHMSSKITSISERIVNIATVAQGVRDDLKEHAKEDDRRFERVHERIDERPLRSGRLQRND